MGSAPRSKMRRRVIWGSVAGVVVIVAALSAWLGVRAMSAKQELQAIVPLVGQLQSSVAAGRPGDAQTAAKELGLHAARARGLTDDPVWRVAEIVPFVGPNLSAARQLAAAADQISTGIVTPLVTVSRTIDPDRFKPVDGHIDLAPLAAAAPTLARVQAAYSRVHSSVDAIGTAGTIGVVSDAVRRVRGAVDEVGPMLTGLSTAARLLPEMLGVDGPRNILLLAQNPAELRATGGLVGSLALIHTDSGSITLTAQASTSDFPPLDAPVAPVPVATQGIYGQTVGRYIQDVNLTPNFPLAAQLASLMWRAKFGGTIDGVIAVDPVALSYLLAATGPVTIADGRQLTSDNAVSLLLSEAYQDYPSGPIQDEFFASAASAVFRAVASGSGDATGLIRALSRAGDERRLLVWIADPAAQSVLAKTTLAGTLPTSTSSSAGIGVYFNDATGAKMDYYLRTSVSVATGVCRADRKPTSRVTVTLTNTAPADAAQTLPDYVTGAGFFGVPPGSVRTRVAVYGPEGGLLVATSAGGAAYPTIAATDTGRPVSLFTVDLAPGASKTVEIDLLDVKQHAADARLTVTPTLGGKVGSNVALACH